MSDKAVYTIELNDKLSPGIKKAVMASMGLDKQMGKTRGSIGKSKKSLGMLGGGFTKLLGPIGAAVSAAVALKKAFDFGSESIGLARQFETLENAVKFASGSAQEGTKNLKFLKDQAEALGLPLKESTEGFKTLAASMMGSKLQGDPTREIFKSVSIAASAMGLSAEDAKGTFLALGQIMGKGKVQAEELRGQIGERIPGAFNIAAKAMGVTQAELNKLMDDGKLVAEDFLPKFAAELKNTFQGALPKAVNSSQAQLNRFNNTWLEIKLSLGRFLLPIVNKIMSAFRDLINFLKVHKAFLVNQIINPIKTMFKVFIGTYKEIFSELFEGFSSSASAGDMFRGVVIGIGKVLRFLVPIVKFLSKVMVGLFTIVIKSWKLQTKIVINIFKFLWASITYVVNQIKLRFLGLKDIIAGAFALDKEQINKGLKTYATAGREAAKEFSDIMSKDITIGGIMSAAAQKIGLAGAAANPNKKSSQIEVFNLSKSLARFNKPAGTGKTITTGGKASSTSVDGIKSGRPTHINIDIGKLIENMNITAANVDDLTGQIKDQVAAALFSAVNNVNNIAGA